VCAVNAVGKIARRFRDGYDRFFHESDYQSIRFSWLFQQDGRRMAVGNPPAPGQHFKAVVSEIAPESRRTLK